MTVKVSRRKLASILLGAVVARSEQVASAQPNPAPAASATILSISGHIASNFAGNVATFDRASLEALPQRGLTTKTPWYDDAQTFTGVLVRDLLASVGSKGTNLLVVALNDYTSEIPIDDFHKYDVLLALKRGGSYMPVSDKGPLFIVYPYDSDSSLRTEKYYSRSAWQVAQFIVE